MIIDFHVHIGKQEHWHPWVNELFSGANPELYKDFDKIMNPDGLERYLKKQGLDHAVILAENSPVTTGVVPNTYVEEFCRRKDMFIPFASMDPRTEVHPKENLRRLVEKNGFAGLKLYPSYQYYHPDDDSVYPLYEAAEKLKIPVMVHTGTSVFKGSRLKYANPLFLDDVAVDFPNLKIIMAHSGRGLWYEEAAFLARLHENIFMDISGLPPKKLTKYFPDLDAIADKVVFGSDWPGVKNIKENIEKVKKLKLKKSTIEKILGLNAASLLGIK
ncbi:MAG: amidohydrolase [Thermoplasmata archaeon]|nr:MAG: amidohydrolase [Thermoplasmata archaeon]